MNTYEMNYCQRCGTPSEDWLCIRHMDDYEAERIKAVEEELARQRWEEKYAQLADEWLIKEEERLRKGGWF